MKRLSAFIVLLLFLFLPAERVIAANAPDRNGSSITSTTPGSDQVRADGVTKAYVTLTLKDADGNPLSGDSVSLSITNDPSAVISPALANLDGNGKVVFTITSTHEGVDIITAIDNSQSVTLTGLGTVTFYASDCYAFPPTSAPSLLSVISIAKDKVKLNWKKATGTVTHYALSYGKVSENYIYGAANIGNQDTTEYTVGSLAIGTTYYFVVRAVNNCAPGAFSNELSATVGINITPTPTSKSQAESETQTSASECPSSTPVVISESCDDNEVNSNENVTASKTTNYVPLLFMGIGFLALICGVAFYLKSRKR